MWPTVPRDRTYEYFLPASLLGLRCDGGEGDGARLQALRQAMALMEGRHPFHNFAGRRRAYMMDPSGEAAAMALS